jgi:hypothetical protein
MIGGCLERTPSLLHKCFSEPLNRPSRKCLVNHPDIHQRKTHPDPSPAPGFSLENALLGSLLAVLPGLILLQQGNVALGIPVAITLGAVMFLLAGYSDGWRSFGLTFINVLGSLLLVTLGNVIGQRNAQHLLGLDSTPEPEDDAVSRLAARAELSASLAEQLVMALDTEGEPTAEQYDAVVALQAEMILIKMEEQEIRQYRLKRILACIAGTIIAVAVTLVLWSDYSRAEAGKAAWILPAIWQEAEQGNLQGDCATMGNLQQ